MNRRMLSYPLCSECKGSEIGIEIYASQGESITQGRLICQTCQAWYRVQTLRREGLYQEFARNYNLPFQRMALHGEEQKISQIDFFGVTNSPHFMALGKVFFEDWVENNLKSGCIILDFECGTGRHLLSLVRGNIQIIGADLSEEMLLLTGKKWKSKVF